MDPSGNFEEGKGTTGIAVLDPYGHLVEAVEIEAKEYDSMLCYWAGVLEYVNSLRVYFKETYKGHIALSIEDYVLYQHKALSQSNSKLETSKLIGALMMWAHNNQVPVYMRNASIAKKRWTNEILEFAGYLGPDGSMPNKPGQRVPKHAMDAVRHAVHCHNFELGKPEKEVQ